MNPSNSTVNSDRRTAAQAASGISSDAVNAAAGLLLAEQSLVAQLC